jgi:glycosidase
MDWGAVATQTTQPDSLLSWCRYLIQARKAYPALRGGYATLPTDVGAAKAIAYLRDAGTERVLVVANLGATAQTIVVSGLTAHGVPASGPVQAILGDLKGVTALAGDSYSATSLPPYGVRVLYLAGSNFQSTLHGDLP